MSASSRLGFALASALTLGNAACGFAGVLALALEGPSAIPLAAGLIFGAWLFDTVDGMAARAFKVSGPFGAMLDSLCDVVSFGVLPALIAVEAARASVPLAAALVGAGVYLAGALLRLGRYTVKALTENAGGDRLWFEGLSSPAAAMAVAAAALAAPVFAPAWAVVAASALLGLLMVSRLPYPDLVKFCLRRRLWLGILLIPLAALAAAPWTAVLAGVFLVYVAASPLLRLRGARA